jgi:hypothetical protein
VVALITLSHVVMKKLEIEKGWFFGAGTPKMYNWKKDGYDSFGVGISLDFLWKTQEVEIVVAGKHYLLRTQDAIDFARKYNATEKRGNTNLIVVSKSIMQEIEIVPTIEV